MAEEENLYSPYTGYVGTEERCNPDVLAAYRIFRDEIIAHHLRESISPYVRFFKRLAVLRDQGNAQAGELLEAALFMYRQLARVDDPHANAVLEVWEVS